MSKLGKYLPCILLWIAGLGLLAHSVIPHDHHSFNAFAVQEDTCPASQEKPAHHDGCPMHCHALNDLTSEKAVTYVLAPVVHQLDIVIIRGIEDYSFRLEKQPLTVPDSTRPYRDPCLLEFSPLRAPPALG